VGCTPECTGTGFLERARADVAGDCDTIIGAGVARPTWAQMWVGTSKRRVSSGSLGCISSEISRTASIGPLGPCCTKSLARKDNVIGGNGGAAERPTEHSAAGAEKRMVTGISRGLRAREGEESGGGAGQVEGVEKWREKETGWGNQTAPPQLRLPRPSCRREAIPVQD